MFGNVKIVVGHKGFMHVFHDKRLARVATTGSVWNGTITHPKRFQQRLRWQAGMAIDYELTTVLRLAQIFNPYQAL